MASLSIERIQAPSGGLNTDASADYVGGTQAPVLTNLMPGVDGKVTLASLPSGAVMTGITTPADEPTAFWSFDDFALIKGDPGTGVKTWRVDVTALTKTDVTATLVESPLNHVHARYGANVYGAIVDAASPQLGKWDGGATAIVPQANAPFQFTDVQVFAQRLFVLGGTLPGTTTPIINSSRVLFWTDADPAADLSLLASWRDDTVTVPVINQLQYDGDDTPVGLAGCGKYLAIIGSRSINILTGSGSSSFAIRNLTKNLGCISRSSIVEVDDGFYFMSDRGFAFCDGVSVTIVSDGRTGVRMVKTANTKTAAMWNSGFLAISRSPLLPPYTGTCLLYHIPSKTWTEYCAVPASTPGTYFAAVFRTNNYPIAWNGGLIRVPEVTNPRRTDVLVSGAIEAAWTSRLARLASPGQMATITRVMLDYTFQYVVGGTTPAGWAVSLIDGLGNTLGSAVAAPSVLGRQRLMFECHAEADAVQLRVTYSDLPGTDGAIFNAELYDAWIEFVPARNRPTI